MAINFSTIQIHRAIMHSITAKQPNQEHATAEYEPALFPLDDDVKTTIRQRLVDAAGKASRAFELEIGTVGAGTFYNFSHDIKGLSDADFVARSQAVTNKLAVSQTRNNIPGGYVIVLDCTDHAHNLGLYIVIKAELHQALKFEKHEGQPNIKVLNDVFLSPSQKLFKIGMLFERSVQLEDATAPNNSFGCFLFDDQFRSDSRPAEYFYEDFLGFSIGNNGKIQSKRYFDKTATFIKENIPDYEEQEQLLKALNLQFTLQQEASITPLEFAQQNLQEDYRDLYVQQVVNDLPSSIIKDAALLQNSLNKRKINFPYNIMVSGPVDEFDDHVDIIHNAEMLADLTVGNGEYTILKIEGRPYTT